MPTSWFAPIDNYCERLDASFWAEPLNAISNGAFLIAAAYGFALWRGRGGRDWASLWLIVVTAAVGIGSFLFHTFANRWSLLADVLPIAVFIYSYFLLALRRFLHLGLIAGIAITAAFAAFNMSFDRLWFGLFPGVTLNGSVGYIPAALALVTVGFVCHVRREQEPGRAMLWAAGVFALSLAFRFIDSVVCATVPVGTHYLWHALNALVLGILMKAAIFHKGPVHARH